MSDAIPSNTVRRSARRRLQEPASPGRSIQQQPARPQGWAGKTSQEILARYQPGKAPPLKVLVAWNMPFHAEHHALPTVPFHKLPDLHQAVRDHLKTTADGYARFNGDLVADLSKTNS
mgnify:CR=1 FL=1